jgi:ankyrin repeat protein
MPISPNLIAKAHEAVKRHLAGESLETIANAIGVPVQRAQEYLAPNGHSPDCPDCGGLGVNAEDPNHPTAICNLTEEDPIVATLRAGMGRTEALRAQATESNAPLNRELLHQCSSGTTAAVRNLLRQGANPNAVFYDDTPLTAAIMSEVETTQKVDALIAAGADLELTPDGPSNYTPLSVAAANRKVEVIKTLVRNGARIDSQGSPLQYTALMNAAVLGAEDCVIALLALGANPGLKMTAGLTASELSRSCGKEAIAVLIEKSNKT